LVGCTAQTTNTGNNSSSSSSSSANNSALNVNIEDMAFDPIILDVNVGDTVTWTNLDSVPHSIVMALSDGSDFTSATLNKNDKATYTFTEAGSFSYHCGIHPEMIGQVTVSE